MAQPTLALTFQQLIIRVAEYLGVADESGGAAAVPADAYNLDLCKRLVNDGYRRVINANPKWNFLTPTTTVTFVAGTQAYDMPDGFFGRLLMPFTYPATGPRLRIDQVDEAVIRELDAAGATSGDPTVVAFRPKAVTASTTGARWEALFWPTPAAVYVVTARAAVYPNALVNNADQHVCGFQHDELILAAGMAEAERQRDDAEGVHAANFERCLEKSIRLDREANVKNLGSYYDRSDEGGAIGSKDWYRGVDTVGGVAV